VTPRDAAGPGGPREYVMAAVYAIGAVVAIFAILNLIEYRRLD
jgi:hypothetical protein